MTSSQQAQIDPSMDQILASIRAMISEEEDAGPRQPGHAKKGELSMVVNNTDGNASHPSHDDRTKTPDIAHTPTEDTSEEDTSENTPVFVAAHVEDEDDILDLTEEVTSDKDTIENIIADLKAEGISEAAADIESALANHARAHAIADPTKSDRPVEKETEATIERVSEAAIPMPAQASVSDPMISAHTVSAHTVSTHPVSAAISDAHSSQDREAITPLLAKETPESQTDKEMRQEASAEQSVARSAEVSAATSKPIQEMPPITAVTLETAHVDHEQGDQQHDAEQAVPTPSAPVSAQPAAPAIAPDMVSEKISQTVQAIETEQQDSSCMLSQDAMAKAQAAIAELSQLKKTLSHDMTPETVGDKTVNALATDLLKPMLKAWLDANLPSLVRCIVTEQVEKVIRGNKTP